MGCRFPAINILPCLWSPVQRDNSATRLCIYQVAINQRVVSFLPFRFLDINLSHWFPRCSNIARNPFASTSPEIFKVFHRVSNHNDKSIFRFIILHAICKWETIRLKCKIFFVSECYDFGFQGNKLHLDQHWTPWRSGLTHAIHLQALLRPLHLRWGDLFDYTIGSFWRKFSRHTNVTMQAFRLLE